MSCLFLNSFIHFKPVRSPLSCSNIPAAEIWEYSGCYSCVVSPAPGQPEAPAGPEAARPSGWHRRAVDSPSPPPVSPPRVPAVLWEALEAEVREVQQVRWAQAALPSPTVQTGTAAHDSCCQWARASGSGWRAESETCCHWAMRQEAGLWRVGGTG